MNTNADIRQSLDSAMFLTVAEACRLSGYSRSTIARALAEGSLPSYRVGRGRGRIRVDPADLERWAAPRPRSTPSAPNDKGFTLVELLVAVIIIGILAGIAIPVSMNQRAKAYDATVKSDLRHLAVQAELWWDGHDGFPTDATGWAGAQTSGQTSYRAFTAPTGPRAGYVIYGQHAGAGANPAVWVLSSWAGGIPTRTTATVLPEVPPNAGQYGTPANATWQSWSQVGGTAVGGGVVAPDVLAWSDPGLLVGSKIGATTAAVGGWDGHVASDGTDSAWSIVPVTDAPITGRAAQVILGDPAHEWGIQASPWPTSITPPPDAFLVAGTTYTVSAWVKTDVPNVPLNLSARVEKASSWAWVASPISKNVSSVGNGWERLTATFTATPAQATGDTYIAVTVRSRANAGAVAGTILQVTAVQIDRGSNATPFQHQ